MCSNNGIHKFSLFVGSGSISIKQLFDDFYFAQKREMKKKDVKHLNWNSSWDCFNRVEAGEVDFLILLRKESSLKLLVGDEVGESSTLLSLFWL